MGQLKTATQKTEMIKGYLNDESVIKAMTKWMSEKQAQRMARQALTLVRTNDKLQNCSPLSVMAGMIQAAELNLELAGPMGHAYLIPRGNQATFQLGYKGIVSLCYNSQQVRSIDAHLVFPDETFKVQFGTRSEIIHEPSFEEDHGDATHYYVVAPRS